MLKALVLCFALVGVTQAAQTRYDFKDPIDKIEWVQIKLSTGEQITAAIINDYMPEMNGDKTGRYTTYRFKIPFTEARRKVMTQTGYLDYRPSTPELLKYYDRTLLTLPEINQPPVLAQQPAKPTTETYKGIWKTKQLNGTMVAHISKVDATHWQGNFSGTWYGGDFQYNVQFTGSDDALSGQSIVDGVGYNWTGSLKDGVFRANYKGGSNVGFFELKKDK